MKMMNSRKELAEVALKKILTPNTDIIAEGTFELKCLINLSDSECTDRLFECFQDKSNTPEIRQLIAVILSNKFTSVQVPETQRTKLETKIANCYWAETNSCIERILLDLMLDICLSDDEFLNTLLSAAEKAIQSNDLPTFGKGLRTFKVVFETFPQVDSDIGDRLLVKLSQFFSFNSEPIIQDQAFQELVQEILKLLSVLSYYFQYSDRINMGQFLSAINTYTHTYILAKNEVIALECLICLSEIIRITDNANDSSDDINWTMSLCHSIMEDKQANVELRIGAMNVTGNVCQLKDSKIASNSVKVMDTGFLVLKEGIGGENVDCHYVFEIESFDKNHLLPASVVFFQQFFKPRHVKKFMEFLERNSCFDDKDRFHRSAFFLLLGLVMEERKDFIFEKVFDMNEVLRFRTESDDCVRAFGMFALIQATRFAKPKQMEAHCGTIVPLLLGHLRAIFNNLNIDPRNSKSVTLQCVIKALNRCLPLNEIEQELPLLVTFLLEKGKSIQSRIAQRLALNTLTSLDFQNKIRIRTFNQDYKESNVIVQVVNVISLVSENKGLFTRFGLNIIESYREFQRLAPTENVEETYTPWIELMIPLAENNELPREVTLRLLTITQNLSAYSEDAFLTGQTYKLFSALTKYPELISHEELTMMITLMLNDLSNMSDLIFTSPKSKEAYSEIVEDFYENTSNTVSMENGQSEAMEVIPSEFDFHEPVLTDDQESQLQMELDNPDNNIEAPESVIFIPYDDAVVTKKIQIIHCLQQICINTNLWYYYSRSLKFRDAYEGNLHRTIQDLYNLRTSLHPTLRESVIRGITQFAMHFLQCTDWSSKQGVLEMINDIMKDHISAVFILLENYSLEMVPLISAIIQFFKYGLKFAGKEIFQLNQALKVQFTNLLKIILGDDRSYWPLSSEAGETETHGIYEDKSIFFDEVTDLVKYLGQSLPTEEFVVMFSTFLPCMEFRLGNLQNMDKAFILGMIAECMKYIATDGHYHFDACFTLFKLHADNPIAEIRNNSIYGLGEMAYYSKNVTNRKKILETLQPFLLERIKKETNQRVAENIIAALARLIVTHADNVAVTEILKEIFKRLPLKEDLMENHKLFLCFHYLYIRKQNILFPYLGPIIRNAGYVLANKSKLAFEGTGSESAKLIVMVERLIVEIKSGHPDCLYGAFGEMKHLEINEILELEVPKPRVGKGHRNR